MMKMPVIVVLLTAIAPVLAPAADLESMLRIGIATADAPFRWGLRQSAVQGLLGGEGQPGKAGTREWTQDLGVSDGECHFAARLAGARADGLLNAIRMDGAMGPAEACVARASQLMTRLYAQPPTVERRAWMEQPRDGVAGSGWVTTWTWETRSTCARLSWSTPGSSRADVTISLRSTGCGLNGKNITAVTPDARDIPPLDPDSVWELLLRLGLNAPDPAIRWDTPLTELQRRFAAIPQPVAANPADIRLKFTVTDSSCQYDAETGGSRAGEFTFVRLAQSAGESNGCRERILAQLTRLYGEHAPEVEHAKWFYRRKTGVTETGDIHATSWDAKVACVQLVWYEGAGYPGARNVLTLDSSRGCGGELDGYLRSVNMVER